MKKKKGKISDIDFNAIFITVGAVVGGIAFWEMAIKPAIKEKRLK